MQMPELKDCASKDANNCLPTTRVHIRPAQSYTLNKQPARTYSYKLIEGPKSSPLRCTEHCNSP